MFKRLFISLIILSTLTSEGIVRFSGDFGRMCMLPQGSFNMLQSENKGFEKGNKEAQFSGALYRNATANKAFLFKLKSSWKLGVSSELNLVLWGEHFYIPINDIYNNNIIKPVYDNVHYSKSKELIIEKSDSSPPILI